MREPTVWVDFENTPHVLLLEPFARWALSRGCDVLLTAKPQAQTVGLARARGLDVRVTGSGDLRTGLGKRYGGIKRAFALAALVRGRIKPSLLISSSRSASIAAQLVGIPAIGIMDYEHSAHWPLALACRTIWMPDLLLSADLPQRTRRVARFFPGLKENLYLDDWVVDREEERRRLGIIDDYLLVVARPPAETAHYQSDKSMIIWQRAVEHLHNEVGCHIFVLARDDEQRGSLRSLGQRFGRLRVLEDAVVGPALVCAADLVLGGGGTMNREAVVLGVPVWSVFCGPAPHIDESLAREGRLTWVRSDGELMTALAKPIRGRRTRRGPYPAGIRMITEQIEALLNEARRRN